MIEKLPYEFTRFYDFSVNPKIEDIEKGISLINQDNYDMVVAVGGGSVMDIAKAINVLAAQSGNPADYITTKETIENKGKPLVAIPTTSGSGSEATHFSVVYIDKAKYSLAHEFLLPDYSIVDPDLTMSASPYLTACTGMDALSQAIESYWSVNSTDESKTYSREAIKLVFGNLETAVNDPDNESRFAMAKASNLAGKAINITKTTAPHAISYTFTSHFDVPHGHAVALTLGKMLIYNASANEGVSDHRGEEYLETTMENLCNIMEVSSYEEAQTKIKTLMKDIGLKTNLTDLGITNSAIYLTVKNINFERLKNNPRKLTEENLRAILASLF